MVTLKAHQPLVAVLASGVGSVLPVLLAGTLVVQLQNELGVSEPVFGGIVTAYFLTAAILSPWIGPVVDRWEWIVSIRFAALASAASFAATALLTGSIISFVFPFLVGSIGMAVAHPAGNLCLTRTTSPRRLGLILGIKQSANPLAGVLAGLAVPLIGVPFGWRWAFFAATAVPLLVLWVTPRRGVRRRQADGAIDLSMNRGVQSPVAVGPSPTTPDLSIRRSEPRLLAVLAVAGGLGAVGATALGTFLVLSAVNTGVSHTQASLYVVLASCVGVGVRIGTGWLADRYSSSGMRPVGVMLMAGAIAYTLLATQAQSLVLPAAILAYGTGWGWPGLFHLGVVRSHTANVGQATGAVQTGMLVGGAIGPFIFGLILAFADYRAAWLTVASISAAAGLITYFAARLLKVSQS